MHSELCPVCKGGGTVVRSKVTNEFIGPGMTLDVETKRFDCHGCEGKGWVPVENSKEKQDYIDIAFPPLNPLYIYIIPHPDTWLTPFYTIPPAHDTRTTNDTTPN